MKIKIKKIEDPYIKVAVHTPENRVEAIKAEIMNCNSQTELCEVAVYDMWDDMPDK